MPIRSIVLLAALLHVAPAMAAVTPISDNGKALMKEGMALDRAGKSTEALKLFKQAALADPAASQPLSSIAYLYYRSQNVVPAKDLAALRQQAADLARAALKLDESDTTAMEVLRALADDTPQERHKPSKAAEKVLTEGENLFQDHEYAAAAEKFQQAIPLDPANAETYLLLGDCYFMQGDMVQSEKWFLKATQVDALYGAAWRFMFDAQMRQGKLKDAEASAIGAIAALPSERQSWMRVNQVLDRWGSHLTPFRLVPRASYKDKSITMDPGNSVSDGAIWLMYAVSLAKATDIAPKGSPFAIAFDAWESTMKTMDELDKKDPVKDEGLRAMLRFHKAGELKAAIFLLQYREAYRPDFEAWKKANPGAIKRFIDTFQVGI